MADSIRSDVTELLSKNEKRKFYVYALCEKNENREIIPFYIGKGEGERIWAHEDGINNELEKVNDVDLDEKYEISEKYKKIEELRNKGIEVEKIIIKWGMTEDEAFMAESALINLLKIDKLKVSKNPGLTNIQNGHRSKVEEKEGILTKARSVDEFYKECAKKPIKISDIPCKVMIRNINKGYPDCNNQENVNDAVRETVRAFWREGKPTEIDYVFAAYKGRIVGVYKVVKEKNPKKFDSILDYLKGKIKTPFPGDNSLKIRQNDLKFINSLKEDYDKEEEKERIDEFLNEYYKNHKREVEEFFGKIKDNAYHKALKNFIHRKYYNLKDVEDENENIKDIEGRSVLMKDIVGRRILKDDGKNLFNKRQTFVVNSKERLCSKIGI